MCEPATLAMASFALTAVTTGAGLYAQQQQASAMSAYNRQASQNALIARDHNLSALERERSEAAADTREEMTRNQMALRAAQATARVSAGEAGVSGLSVDALLRDLASQAGYDNATAAENFARTSQNIDARRENAHIAAVNNISSLQPVQQPNYLGAALQIGQGGLNSYTRYQDRLANQRSAVR